VNKKNQTEFIRVEKNRDYTVIHNQFLKREDLSWKAKGILAYILSLPNDWNINLKEIMKHATEGERAFRSGWKELKETGYVERKPVRDGNRIKYWETVVREIVDMKGKPELCGFEDVQNEDVRNEDVQNSKLLSTNSTKYLNKQNTDNTNKEHSPADAEPRIPYKEIVNHLNQKADRGFRHTTDKTKRLIKARWNQDFELNDFKKVIDIKTEQWKNDTEMEKYLRPQTLFGTKFESYLNEQHINSGGDSYGGIEF